MNELKNIYILLIIIGFTQGCGDVTDPLKVTMTHDIVVLTEDRLPIADADISVTFHNTPNQKKQTKVSYHTKEAKSEIGPVTVTSEGINYTIINVSKEGYWSSSYPHRWRESSEIGERQKAFEIILRKRENPRPLYVQETQYHSTQHFGVPLGYDLMAGDLVAPNGKGKDTDLVFTLVQQKGDASGVYENRLTVTFPNAEDGIIEVQKGEGSQSELVLGSLAPEEGYAPRLELCRGVEKIGRELFFTFNPSKEELEQVDGYWFRVRSQRDPETGELQAHYGKIAGPIQFRSDEQGGAFFFTYFLAPDESRSLEFNGESLIPRANLQGVNMH